MVMGLPTSTMCYCTLDEYLDGHRHHCPQHVKCFECEEDEALVSDAETYRELEED